MGSVSLLVRSVDEYMQIRPQIYNLRLGGTLFTHAWSRRYPWGCFTGRDRAPSLSRTL